MAEDIMLQEAVSAIRGGEKARARDLLTRLIKNHPNRPESWIYLSAVVETREERVYCLQEALRRDPLNAAARRGLVMAGGIPPAELPVNGPRLPRRMWQPVLSGSQLPRDKRITRRAALFGAAWGTAGIFLIGLVLMVISGMRPKQTNPLLVNAPALNTARPTATLVTIATLVVRSPTPTFMGPTPLWMFLEQTYTPTPVYVNTPHPRTEAYRSAMRAYESADWGKMLSLMEQVVIAEPGAADAFYHLGEAYRLQGMYSDAVDQYNLALQANSNFAPAFLGRARALYAQDPDAQIEKDLKTALTLDPGLFEARLELARIAVDRGDAQVALEILDEAETFLPDSPQVALYRARAWLVLGDVEASVEQASLAIERDQTLLEAYRILGEALQASGRVPESLEPLEVFIRYQHDDALAWVMLGTAYQAGNVVGKAMDAFSKAIELDNHLFEAYLQRGLITLDQGDGKSALEDLNTAELLDQKSLAARIGKGRAYLMLGFDGDAYMEIERSTPLAVTDQELAVLYYWKARSLDALERVDSATRNWQALLDLPEKVVPAEWLAEAETRLNPTPTSTVRVTQTPGRTNVPAPKTPTATPRSDFTRKQTSTAHP